MPGLSRDETNPKLQSGEADAPKKVQKSLPVSGRELEPGEGASGWSVISLSTDYRTSF